MFIGLIKLMGEISGVYMLDLTEKGDYVRDLAP